MMQMYYPNRRRALRRAMLAAASSRPSHIHIPVDVRAEDDAFVISALLPGLDPDDLNIEVLDDLVTISGEFADVTVEEGEEVSYLLQEVPTGQFKRSLRLPTALDAAKAEADVKNGVLTLRVYQAEYAKPKQIKVKAK